MTESAEQNLRTADIGKIVHYMPSNIIKYGDGPLPAMILRVLKDGTCNLMVFFDGDSSYGLKRVRSVPYSATGEQGTWHWMDRRGDVTMLKLYVVGELSSNPDDWGEWSEYALVIAESPRQAIELSGHPKDSPVAEVDMSKPTLLVQMSEPKWGEDL